MYTTANGLLENQFNYKSALKGEDGKFYFGGIDGLIAFDPNSSEKVTFVVSGRGNKRQVKKETTKFHRIAAKKEEKLVETDDESAKSNPRRRQSIYKGWNS